jgi:hypothetical protein
MSGASEMDDKKFLTDVKNWKLPDPKLVLAKLNKDVPTAPKALWILDDTLSPLDLYCYLNARFGPPNGFAMTLRDDSSDNLIQYHYTLQVGERMVDIHGKNTQVEFILESPVPLTSEDLKHVSLSIKDDLKNYKNQIKEVRQKLEKYRLFVNPYKRIAKIVERFETRLRELNVDSISPPANPRSAAEVQAFATEFQTSIDTYVEASALATSLKMIAPVMAEAFINLLLFVLRRGEIKADERLYDSILRLPIDVRTKGLSLYCYEFDRPIDASDQRFKNFHTVMNQRNDLLHGNVDPQKYGLGDVFFDGNIFIGNETQGLSDRALLNLTKYVEPKSALSDVETIRAFVDFILEHLKPGISQSVKMIMNSDQPGWDASDKHVAVLFPEHLAESFVFTEE